MPNLSHYTNCTSAVLPDHVTNAFSQFPVLPVQIDAALAWSMFATFKPSQRKKISKIFGTVDTGNFYATFDHHTGDMLHIWGTVELPVIGLCLVVIL